MSTLYDEFFHFRHVVRPFGTLPEDVSYLHQPGQETLVNMTYGQLIDRAGELFGDRIFIQSEHQLIKCTYREVSEKVTNKFSFLFEYLPAAHFYEYVPYCIFFI